MNELKTLPISPELHDRLIHCSDLPSPTGVAKRIIELCQSTDTSIADITKVIRLDPALSSKMMRIANSPLYARKREIKNLRQAIALFGLNGTLTLALAFSLVIKASKHGAKPADFNYAHYWRRSLASAVFSQLLGDYLSVPDRDELFLTGLLQDIGMLALNKIEPKIYQHMGEPLPAHSQICDLERNTIGTDHATVGAWLLNLWKFPEPIISLVANSHENTWPDPNHPFDLHHKIITTSSAVADIWWQDTPAEALEKATDHAEKTLSLSKDIIMPILENCMEMTNEMTRLFDIKPCDETLAKFVMEAAQEMKLSRNVYSLQQSADLRKTTVSLMIRTQELEEENRRDSLTGLFNRIYLEQLLAEEYSIAKDNNYPLTVIFLDLDHFKNVNDTYGHHIGDEILIHCAKIFLSHTRGSDAVARYGGEEFVAVLPGTDQSGAETVCGRILETIRTRPYITAENISIDLTASVGIATLNENHNFETPESIIRSADRALYLAKTAGRNRLAVYR